MEVSDNGERESQGRPGQEGQAQEGEPLTCQICQLPDGAAHGMKQHKFTPLGVPIDTRQFDRKRGRTPRPSDDTSRRIPSAHGAAQTPQSAGMFDPVLRMALIDAGIITVEQLQEAEKKISVFTQQITQTGPVYRGE